MPVIRANRDSIDDRFSVLGFSVRTESPLFEVGIATDPELFKPENRPRRTRRNFYSSRMNGALRARRGEAVYLVPPDVMTGFVGSQRLYFGLATYSENNRVKPDFVQSPTAGNMYVNTSGLTERGLRRLIPGHMAPSSYGGKDSSADASLEWGGDLMPANGAMPASAPPGRGDSVPTAPSNGSAATNGASAPATAQAYSDGYSDELWHKPAAPMARSAPVRAQSIPLDPGEGGRSIGLDALQAGDLIVSTARAAVSYAIRAGTFSGVSHAILYVGDGKVIEAVGSGVREVTLADAIRDAILAVAFRDPRVDADRAQAIVGYARAQVGKPYNYGGVAATGYRLLNPIKSAIIDAIRDRLGVSQDTAKSFYCSELVFAAYAEAGVPLMAGSPGASTADSIVQLSRGTLAYVGHLKGQDELLGIALGLAEVPEAMPPGTRLSAGALSAEAPEVEVKLRVFIPAPALPAPGVTGTRGFHGDGRSFSYSGGTSRAEIKANVRLGMPGVAPAINSIERSWGETSEYRGDDLVDMPGRADWYKSLAEGATPIARARLPLTADNLKIVLGGDGSTTNNVISISEGTTLVTLVVDGANPLVSGSPNIDATLHLHLKLEGSRVKAWLLGSHDGFPAYELYVGRKRIYGYDPEAAGESPTALFPPEDKSTDTGYVDIGEVSAVAMAQGLAAGARALSDQCWSIHWNTVPYIEQQTDASCWAAAAAMVVGWRDGTRPTDADIASKVAVIDAYRHGLPPSERRVLADAWNLVAEPPASYTIDAWRDMLERYGPLYLDMTNSGATGGHAWVLVGMTSDGAEDGSDTVMYLHNPTASRGRVKWPFADFLRFYEGRVKTEGRTLERQIMHAAAIPTGLQPAVASPFSVTMSAAMAQAPMKTASKAVTTPLSAAGRATRALSDLQSWSVHWDTVPYIAQQTDASCWAAAAAMVVGWRDSVSIPDSEIAAKVPVIDAYLNGLPPSQRQNLAMAWDLVGEPPASYTIGAWREMLETYGPLYLSMTNSRGEGGHAWVLVGMTSDGAEDGSDTVMFLHNPTPSRGRVKWPFQDFLRFYENRARQKGIALSFQIMHAASRPAGVQPAMASPFALMMGADMKDEANVSVSMPPPPAPIIGQALQAPAQALVAPVVIAIGAAFVGAVSSRVLSNEGDVSWELDQLNGLKHPNNTAPNPMPPATDGTVIRLTDWPKWVLNIGDEISAGFEITWQYNGQSVGNIAISNVATNDAIAWGLKVKAHIIDDAIVYPRDNPTFAAIKIRFEYRFDSPIHDDAIAIQDVHLFGNGRYNVTGRWEQS